MESLKQKYLNTIAKEIISELETVKSKDLMNSNITRISQIISDRISFVSNEIKDYNFSSETITKTFMSCLRKEYLKVIETEQSSHNFLDIFLECIIKLVIYLTQFNFIDYSTCLIIVDEIFELAPIEFTKNLYVYFEEDLLKRNYTSFKNKENFSILKIVNNLLKRFSPVVDTEFRGRIQMTLSNAFSLYDPSGVNARGQINIKNQNYSLQTETINQNAAYKGMEIENEVSTSVVDSINKKFFQQFWITHKMISNPFIIFNSNINSEDCRELVDMKQIKEETTNTDTEVMESGDKNILNLVLNNISFIVQYFDMNKGNNISILENNISKDALNNSFSLDKSFLSENSIISLLKQNQKEFNLLSKEKIFSYPKFLASLDLFTLHLQDPSFKTIIVFQYLIFLKMIIDPINVLQRKAFIINTSDKQNILKIQKEILKYLENNNKGFYHIVVKTLYNEVNYEKWKENYCSNNSQSFAQENEADLISKLRKIENSDEYYCDDKSKLLNSQVIFPFSSTEAEFNEDYFFSDEDLHKTITYSFNKEPEQGIYSESPYLGRFIEKYLADENPIFEIENEFKIKNNQVSRKLIIIISIITAI